MIERYFDIYINAGESIAPTIHVNQYDDSEQWVFTVYGEDNEPIVPTDAAVCGRKSDGHVILNSASVVDGKVVVAETKQMTAAPGVAVYELLLNGASHGTANFRVVVEHRPGDEAQYSASDLSLISEAIERSQSVLGLAGLTSEMKTAILNAFANVAWDDGQGQTYYDALVTAFETSGEGVTVDTELSPISTNPVENKAITQAINELKNALLITESASGNPAVFTDGARMQIKSLTAEINPIQTGEGEPSLENIRPIEGYDSVSVGVTGKNLLKYPYYQTTRTTSGITFTDNGNGSITANGTATANAYFYFYHRNQSKLYLKEGSYILSDQSVFGDSYTGCGINYTNANGGETGVAFTSVNAEPSFEVTDYMAENGIGCYIRVKNGATLNNVTFKPMIRPVDTDSEYEQYKNTSVLINLGQTVYKGTLNVTTGELTVTHRLFEFDGVTTGKKVTAKGSDASRYTNYYLAVTDGSAYRRTSAGWCTNQESVDLLGFWCSHGEWVASYSSGFRPGIYINNALNLQLRILFPLDMNITTVDECNQWLADQATAGTPVQMLYALKEPLTFTINPVKFYSYLGNNVVSANSGPVDVEYYASLKLYIDKVTS